MAMEKKSFLVQLLPFWIIFGAASLVAGICCLCVVAASSSNTSCTPSTRYSYKEVVSVEYSNCTGFEHGRPCYKETFCDCLVSFVVPQNVVGDVVFLYELNTFNQSNQPDFFQSRDDNQLRGILTDTPSKACEPFRYDDNKRPIAPCGALADAMFNDKISVTDGWDEVPLLSTGLILEHDKLKFKNPAPQDDLETAFGNFSKPKSWVLNIWELDKNNSDNNGFQNEAFIAWMRTDWSQKPLYRLNRTGKYEYGLPAGNYSLNVAYNYPHDRYPGPRTVIIAIRSLITDSTCGSSEIPIQFNVSNTVGITGICIGIIFLILGILLVITRKSNDQKQSCSDILPPPASVPSDTKNNIVEVSDAHNQPYTNNENKINNTRPPKQEELKYVPEKPIRTNQEANLDNFDDLNKGNENAEQKLINQSDHVKREHESNEPEKNPLTTEEDYL